jgi:hypothetical protein
MGEVELKQDWQEFAENPPPRDEMFIWARPKVGGGWSLGLAYWNVSGGWSDAYGSPHAFGEATHWKPIGPPPAKP